MDRRQVWIVRGLNLGYFAVMGLMIPLLPLYFSLRGYNSAQVGLFMVAGPFLAVFSQPLWGYVSDRLRSVKKILFALWIMTVLCSIGLFRADGFWTTLLSVSAVFFFFIPSSPLLDSASVLVAQQAGVSYGSIRLWGSVGFALVAIASAYLLAFVGGLANLQYLFWAFWVFPLILIWFFRDQQAAARPISLRSLKEAVNREFVWLLVIVAILSTSHRANDSMLPLYIKSLGGTEQMVSWAFGIAAVFEIVTFLLIPRWLNRYHELGLMAIAAALYAVRWLLYGLVDAPAAIVALQVLHAATFGVYWVVLIHYVGRIVPAHFRSTGLALLAAVHGGVAALIGGYGGGIVMDRLGGETLYGITALLAGIAALLLFLTRFRQNIRSS